MTENELKTLLKTVTPPNKAARAAAHAHWAALAKPRQLCRKRSLSAVFRSRWQTCATNCELSKHSMKFLPLTLGFASKG